VPVEGARDREHSCRRGSPGTHNSMVLVVNNGPEADPRGTPTAAMAVTALILPVCFIFALAQN